MRQPVFTQANEERHLEDAFDQRLRIYGDTLEYARSEALECIAVPDLPVMPTSAMEYLDQRIQFLRVRRALRSISESCIDAYSELMIRGHGLRASSFGSIRAEAICLLDTLHLPELPVEQDMPYVAYVLAAVRKRLEREILAFLAAPVDSPAKGSLLGLGIALHAVGLHSFGECIEAGLCYATKVPRAFQQCWDLWAVRSELSPRYTAYEQEHAVLMEHFVNEAEVSCRTVSAA